MPDKYDRETYESELKKLDDLLGTAILVSDTIGGIKTSTRYVRATQLYTRLVAASLTFLRVLPGNKHARTDVEWWDWPSIGMLARGLIETYNTFFYIGVEKVSSAEVEFRINLMHFHLNSEKYRLYRDWGKPDEELQDFVEGLPIDKDRLKANVSFQSLPERQQIQLLKGKTPMHLSHHEINERAKIITKSFKPIYRLFSNQVHTTPLSFQSQSNIRGRGFENDAERFYITLATQVAVKYLANAVINMADIFPKQLKKQSFLIFLERARKLARHPLHAVTSRPVL